jgi:hypothetical protein
MRKIFLVVKKKEDLNDYSKESLEISEAKEILKNDEAEANILNQYKHQL